MNDDELRIAIKKVEGGRFSNYALDRLQIGQTIDVMTPNGRFTTPITPDAARNYVLCATGSGITPIISIIKTVMAAEEESRMLLFYGNRTVEETLFRDDIQKLEDRYGSRLKVCHFLSRQAVAPNAFEGRLDGRAITLAKDFFGDLAAVDACFMCGLVDMTRSLGPLFSEAGLPEDRIHVELFEGPGIDQPLPAGVVKDATAIILQGDGRTELKLGASTVLDAALEAGLDLPYSCRTGSCSTCLAKIVSGKAHMIANSALDAKAVAAGYVLSCQTHALTPELVLDFNVADVEP